jgi:3-oxoacyl-[acyl-carrier protein] reductase
MEINGKTALVLGASKGVGKAISLALAKAGATVIATYFGSFDESTMLQKELAHLGVDHLVIQVDLRDPDEVKSLLQQVQDNYGALHILINNIERGGMPVVHGSYDLEVNKGQWDLEMETTLKAKWLVAHHALPLIKKSGDGIIINLSSIAGLVGRSGPAGLVFNDGYAAANRAVSSFTETWARQGAPEVRVNELMLGFFETRHAEGTRGWKLLQEEEKEAVVNHILLKRTGCLDDIIKAVLYLVSDATYMTGAVIRLDGGYFLGGEGVPTMPEGVIDREEN